MSAFDNLAQAAATEEAKAKGLAARVWSKLPARAPARIEVAVERHRSSASFAAMTACAMVALFCMYRLGGADARAELASYIAEERTVAATEAGRQATARSLVEAAANKRAADADARAASLQTRIDGYVADLAHRPADARCTLTDGDLRRLRDDTPAAPARPRRRPARPAGDAD